MAVERKPARFLENTGTPAQSGTPISEDTAAHRRSGALTVGSRRPGSGEALAAD